jgi:4-amino-4-deoxy-L-arabinose transferase-like glycosyltransferase
MTNLQKPFWIFIVLAAVYFCAVGVDTMDEDASQYVSMSREMKESGSYLQVYEQGKDYLDKPPFLFWINAVSMKVFGENNFAYKLPSILFALLSLFAVYRLAVIFYDERIALLSALILGSSQAVFLITNDVRTDTILMGWVITALWLLAEWLQNNKTVYFLLGCVAIGGGMITKGPVALFVPVFALGSHLLAQRKFSYLFKPVYLLGIGVIALVLLPMSIGLYRQFDLHPEKTVNGLQHVSGLRFFYWTQSFGRITGESVWNNHASFSFLFENLLWGMLPWTLFFIGGCLFDWISIAQKKFRITQKEELITTGGILLTYCSLAVSKYQLPHYIYVVLPLIAISTAKMIHRVYWENKTNSLYKVINVLQVVIVAGLIVVPVLIMVYVFPAEKIWPWILPVVALTVVLWIALEKKQTRKLFYASLSAIIVANIFMSIWFYPQLLQYQAGNVVGRMITEKKIDNDSFFLYRFSGSYRNIHFYARRIVSSLNDLSLITKPVYLLTMQDGITDLKASGRKFTIEYTGQDFHVSALTGKFLNKETRFSKTKTYYLVRVE